MAKVLFVCVENSCRSQMAEAFARDLGGSVLEVYSAGSRPSGKVNPQAIEVMREVGIDMALHRSKSFTDLGTKEFDYVITLGCKDTCPLVPAKKTIDWNISDPKGKDIEFFREVRDEIEERVEEFVRSVGRLLA